ncbi:MAG: hypothetical protein ACYTBJ_19355 [Planctomycetota bacterium]|jgi:hypothetical protein
MDARAMAQAIKAPVVILPRLNWVPLFGAWLGRVLPPKRYQGKVLSYMEFLPYQQQMAKAQQIICEGCQKPLRQAPEPPAGVDGPEWFGCVCEGDPVPGRAFNEEEWAEVCKDFIGAQGLPVRGVMMLPGSVLLEVMQELFLFQTGANSPRQVMERMVQMSGKGSRSKDSVRPKGENVRKTGR